MINQMVRRLALTKTRNDGLADAASGLTRISGAESVLVAAAATVDELKTSISGRVIVP